MKNRLILPKIGLNLIQNEIQYASIGEVFVYTAGFIFHCATAPKTLWKILCVPVRASFLIVFWLDKRYNPKSREIGKVKLQ